MRRSDFRMIASDPSAARLLSRYRLSSATLCCKVQRRKTGFKSAHRRFDEIVPRPSARRDLRALDT